MAIRDNLVAFAPRKGGHQIVEMSVFDWQQVPDNPRQRDTERHLRRAAHLMKPSPTHARVAMAMTPKGERWKLDGHTRALAWSRNMGFPPGKVIVDVYEVRDATAAMELYQHFDNQAAVETATDMVSGGWRELGYSPESNMLKRGAITAALRIAQGLSRGARVAVRDQTTYELMKAWLEEIKVFDSINPQNTRFTAPIVVAALMTLRRRGAPALDFWKRYNDDAGEKIGEAMDPVEALSRFMMETRQSGHASGKTYDVIGKGLAAFEAHLKNKTYTRGFTAIDPTRYLAKVNVAGLVKR